MKAFFLVHCLACGHRYEVEVIDPREVTRRDGTVEVRGFAGSALDFCEKCEGATETEGSRVVEPEASAVEPDRDAGGPLAERSAETVDVGDLLAEVRALAEEVRNLRAAIEDPEEVRSLRCRVSDLESWASREGFTGRDV